MANQLFIIEAPGKRKQLSNMLWRAGLRDVEVMATVGHIAANPDGFRPLGVDAEYRETAYRLKPGKAWLAADIGKAAKQAKKIYIATDDDQEGDVIARDVLRFCLEAPDAERALRVRLRALAPSEIKDALAQAQPFDDLSAARGDARRIIDRLIGSLSNDVGAVGRVQGSLLLALQEQQPVVGIMTYTLQAADDKGDWIAQVPVFSGDAIPEEPVVQGVADTGQRREAMMSDHVMNHDDILLSASLATGEGIDTVSRVMQNLYEQGKMTYPRAKDRQIAQDSFRRLQGIAMKNGTGFDASRFNAIRVLGTEHAHEAPNPMVLDVPVNRDFDSLSVEDKVLVHITRNLIECGLPCQYETPRADVVSTLRPDVAGLDWHRVVPTGHRLWEPLPVQPGFAAWTKEQSLLHFMSRNEMGRPSTVVAHIAKFLGRELVNEDFGYTRKGQEWGAQIGEIFNHQNISRMIEQYIDTHRKSPQEMVAEMIDLCGLNAVGSAMRQRGLENDDAVQTAEFC
jgi:DNA topoisomerase-1